MDTKRLTFALIMGALGSALFAISYYAGPIAPGIALDFSLIAIFIAGFYGGPSTGFVAGILAGILPGIMFGPMGMGGVAGLIGLPLGKALSGLTSGLLARILYLHKKPHSSLVGIPITYLSYVPEAVFTYVYFVLVMGSVAIGGNIFFTAILPKAIIEVTIISVIIASLMGNNGFNSYVRAHFTKMKPDSNSLQHQKTENPDVLATKTDINKKEENRR
jgi:LytS/YehU family sensor histidine kinase